MAKDTGSRWVGVLLFLFISAHLVGLLPALFAVPRVSATELPDEWDYRDGPWAPFDKPGLPELIQGLSVGSRITYVVNLDNDAEYHVYFYGSWIGSTTDYDIAVYDPDGIRVSYHTESHGLIEHLGTTVTDPLFKPEKDGAYSIYVLNDPKESGGMLDGTLMVVENLKVNTPYNNKLYMVGKHPSTNAHQYLTTWVYEFNTTSPRIEVPIEVPDTLDMYEARLYLMANPAAGLGMDLLGIPLPWEPGLYNGMSQGSVGGSNDEDTGYRGNVFDSCEYWGEDMILSYTAPTTENLLYHLVFIAELGEGNVQFRIRTEFVKPYLAVSIPSKGYPGEVTPVTAVANDTESGMEKVTLAYSTDDGATWATMELVEGTSQTYTGEIPGQAVGTTVLYKIVAQDNAGNQAIEEGSYETKYPSQISCDLSAAQIVGGQSVTVSGVLNPPRTDADIVIQYVDPTGGGVSRIVKTGASGDFTDTYTPDMGGVWAITARWGGDPEYHDAANTTQLTVLKVTTTLSLALSKDGVTLGDSLDITGSISPAFAGATIKIYLTDPTGAITTRQAQTSGQGTYTLAFTPDAKGEWTITASFMGDDLHKGSSSESVPLGVSGGLFDWPLVLIFPGAAAAVAVAVIFLLRRRRGPAGYEGY